MKGKSLLAALIALGIFSGSAYAAPSFKQSGNKFTINEGADDAAVRSEGRGHDKAGPHPEQR